MTTDDRHENRDTGQVQERRMRSEASSVWLDTLSTDQQRAFKVLIDLLAAALRDLPSKAEWDRGRDLEVDVDEKERSRLLLLGGGRGSGKTTVANTLREVLNDGELFSEPVTDEVDHRPNDGDSKIVIDRRTIAQAVEHVRKRIIVLEPLSMEHTPSETNVLAALLARIEELLFPKLTHEDVPSTSGENKRHRAVLDLLRLQTDVALAWNGNLRDRKGHLDPDNYAMEELRVERVRLQLRARFAQVLRHTARDGLSRELPTMFLLIVDDADVSPGQVMDLVERLRMVGVPELAVLLVGNVEMLELVFRLNFADRFSAAGGRVDATAIGVDPTEFASLTNSLARSSLRKHIPYHQRVQLQPLLARDAVKITPLRTDGQDLGTMLDKVDVSSPSIRALTGDEGKLKLREFLYPLKWKPAGGDASPTETEREVGTETPSNGAPTGTSTSSDGRTGSEVDDFGRTREREEQSWYVGSRVLADSPRVAVDLWNTLRDAHAAPCDEILNDPWAEGDPVREPGARALDLRLHLLFRQLAGERLDAKTDIWSQQSTPIDGALRERIMRDGNLTALGLSVEHNIDDEDPKGASDDDRRRRLLLSDGRRIRWSGHRGLTFRISGTPAAESRSTASVEPRSASIKPPRASRREIGPLVLVEDLWALEYRTAAEHSTARRSRDNVTWVVEQSADGKNVVPWKTPLYRTIRQVEQFGYVWDGFVTHLDQHPEQAQLGELVDAWVTLHTEALLGLAAEPYTGAGDVVKTETKTTEDGETNTEQGTQTTTRVARANEYIENMRSTDDEWERHIVDDWLATVTRLRKLQPDSTNASETAS